MEMPAAREHYYDIYIYILLTIVALYWLRTVSCKTVHKTEGQVRANPGLLML